jgi:hypothetical protein
MPFVGENKEPVNSGESWGTTFNAVGSSDSNGKLTEAGQSVDSASFGAGPRMHPPGAHAYRDMFMALLTGPNADGSSNFQLKGAGGTFTAGQHAGLHFTISDLIIPCSLRRAGAAPNEIGGWRRRFLFLFCGGARAIGW